LLFKMHNRLLSSFRQSNKITFKKMRSFQILEHFIGVVEVKKQTYKTTKEKQNKIGRLTDKRSTFSSQQSKQKLRKLVSRVDFPRKHSSCTPQRKTNSRKAKHESARGNRCHTLSFLVATRPRVVLFSSYCSNKASVFQHFVKFTH